MTIKKTHTLRITNVNQYGDHEAAVDLVVGVEEFIKNHASQQGSLQLRIHHNAGERPWESDSYDLELSWEVS